MLLRGKGPACFSIVWIAIAVTAGPSWCGQSAAAQGRARAPAAQEPALAERRLIEAVRRDPGSFEAHHALAEFYLHRGRIAEAVRHLERAHAIDPSHYANSYDLTVAWLETGQIDRAREHVKRLLAGGETAELLNLLGDVEERAGNFIGAAEPYQRAARMDATEEHLFDWGNNLVRLGAFDDAIEVFDASVARHPTSARLHVGLGIAQYSRGAYDDAVTSFCRAADLAPDDPRPYQFLGEMYGVSPERAGEVTTRLARYVKARPGDPLAHYFYAMSLWKGQRDAVADSASRQIEALLRRAVALDPKLAKAFLQLGILLSEQQRFAEAIPVLQRAVTLEPESSQAHYRLAQAYVRTGRRELAATAFERFEALKRRAPSSPSSPPTSVP